MKTEPVQGRLLRKGSPISNHERVSSGVISPFSWGGGQIFFFFDATRLLKNWKKQHFICSNLTLFLVPFFLSFFFLFFFPFFFFFFLLFFLFFFFFFLGGGATAPQPPSNAKNGPCECQLFYKAIARTCMASPSIDNPV